MQFMAVQFGRSINVSTFKLVATLMIVIVIFVLQCNNDVHMRSKYCTVN